MKLLHKIIRILSRKNRQQRRPITQRRQFSEQLKFGL